MKKVYAPPYDGECCDNYTGCLGRTGWDGCDEYGAPYDYGCYLPKMKCKTSKECVKTYKTYHKLYKICTYRLYKVCSRCGTEFDYYAFRGMCPRC